MSQLCAVPDAVEPTHPTLQQRVAVACALTMEPAVLLCDEITSALAPELVGEVLRVVERLAQEGTPAELFGNPQPPELQQFLKSLHD